MFHLEAPTIWWILSGALVAAELLTGTFYLLLLGLAAAFGGLVAFWGFAIGMQIGGAAVIGIFGVAVWERLKRRKAQQADPNVSADQFDIGQTVFITHWNVEGSTRIHYRGSEWACETAHNQTPQVGNHRITQILNNRLIVEPIANAQPTNL